MVRARKPIDLGALHQASNAGLCFICEMLRGTSGFEHEVVAETDDAVAFLDRYPTLFGRTIVAPKRHLEAVCGDFSQAEYLALQGLVYRVAEAIRKVLSPERVYVLSLGSRDGNAHVHWHIAPLPPGLPLDQQQHHALMHEHGVIEDSNWERRDFVERLRVVLQNEIL
ncbi:MAG: HIT family protein [Pseudomonadota bacterium]